MELRVKSNRPDCFIARSNDHRLEVSIEKQGAEYLVSLSIETGDGQPAVDLTMFVPEDGGRPRGSFEARAEGDRGVWLQLGDDGVVEHLGLATRTLV